VLMAAGLLSPVESADIEGFACPALAKHHRPVRRLSGPPPDGLIFSEAIAGDGPTVFEHACRLGAEGIVSKRAGSLYQSGRCPAWVKVLCPDYERE
jgi:hypothetical protein